MIGEPSGRRSFPQRSTPLLLALASRPRWVVPLLAAVLLVVGLAVSGLAGAVALLVVAALLGWLAALSWPVTDPQGRLLRVSAVVVILLVALSRL